MKLSFILIISFIIISLITLVLIFSLQQKETYIKVKKNPTEDDLKEFTQIPDDIVKFSIYKDFMGISPANLIQLYKLNRDGRRDANALSRLYYGVDVPNLKNIFGLRIYTRKKYQTKLSYIEQLFEILGIQNTTTLTFKERPPFLTGDRKEENVLGSDSEREEDYFKEVVTTKIYSFGDIPHKIEEAMFPFETNVIQAIKDDKINEDIFVFFKKLKTGSHSESDLRQVQIFIRKNSNFEGMVMPLRELVQNMKLYSEINYQDPYYANMSSSETNLEKGYLFSFYIPVKILVVKDLLNLEAIKYKDYEKEITEFSNRVIRLEEGLIPEFLNVIKEKEKRLLMIDIIKLIRAQDVDQNRDEVEFLLKNNFTKSELRNLTQTLIQIEYEDLKKTKIIFLNTAKLVKEEAINSFFSSLNNYEFEFFPILGKDETISVLEIYINNLRVNNQDPESIAKNLDWLRLSKKTYQDFINKLITFNN